MKYQNENYVGIRMRQLLSRGDFSTKEAIKIIATEQKMMKEGFIE